MDENNWCCVQWCDGLSRASSVSNRAARVRTAARLSEAARRIVRLRGHEEVGRVSMCLFRWETFHEETKPISSAKRVATSYWIGRASLQGWSGRMWNSLRTIVVYSGVPLNCCDALMRKLNTDEFACAIRSSDEETESSHEVTDGGESESKRLAITFTGREDTAELTPYWKVQSTWNVNVSEAVRSNLTVKLNFRCGTWITHTHKHTSLTMFGDLRIFGSLSQGGLLCITCFWTVHSVPIHQNSLCSVFSQFSVFSSETVRAMLNVQRVQVHSAKAVF